MSRAVVTGGAGFIGSNLVRSLIADGHEVIVIDNMAGDGGANPANVADIRDSVTRWLAADLAEAGGWEEAVAGAHWVFHLAARTGHAESMRDPLPDLAANVTASLRLVQATDRVAPAAAVVFASTRQVYGRPRRIPVDESHDLVPPDINAIHKLTVEEYLRLRGRVHGWPAVILRLTNTYGPRMRVRDARQCFLGYWIRLALEGGEIPVFGDGEQVRDLSYVDDVVDALRRAAGLATAEVPTFNIGGDRIALLPLARLLLGIAGRGTTRLVPFPEDRRVIDIGSFVADDGAFRRASGWAPAVGLEEGVRRSVEYFRRDRGAYW